MPTDSRPSSLTGIRTIIGQFPLHPILMAMYPILFLLSYNISQINPSQAIRPLTISILVAIFLSLALGFAARDIRQGALSTTLVLILFFTYGHAFNWLDNALPALANHVTLGTIWTALFILGIWAKYRIRNIYPVTMYLNLVLLFLLFQPVANIGWFILRSGVPEEIKPPSPFEDIKIRQEDAQNLPDIYYIILDGYGRMDVVQELFQYDNSPFIEHLQGRGFYVANQSNSNYVQTSLSLASSMNLDYLGNLTGTNIQSEDRDPLKELIRNSQIRNFLEAQGYQTITFATPYSLTNISDSDVFIEYHVKIINELEGLILTTSATRAMDDKMINLFGPLLCDVYRGGALNVFENLKKVPELPGPKFVFAHVVSPHPPFIFDANGNPVQDTGCSGMDGNMFTGSQEEYITGYSRQLAYISQLTIEAVDEILDNSSIPPVIIIQGDHGSGMLLDFNSIENTCLRERSSILNAYYFPQQKMQEQLYESISPVNSFRVVINGIFNSQLPLLEDKFYFSTWSRPYQVQDVTAMIEDTCSR